MLSDPDKKKKYDQFGGDPDARFQPPPSSGGSPFGNFSRGGRGPMFEEEISPEEMFRQFFGGGGPFGGPFGTTPSPCMRAFAPRCNTPWRDTTYEQC